MISEIDRLRRNVVNNLQEIEKLEQENKQLKEEIEELKQTNLITIDYQDLEQRNKDLKSILTELEEWLKEPEYFNGRRLRQDYITVMTTDVLDKIQELKQKYFLGDKE